LKCCGIKNAVKGRFQIRYAKSEITGVIKAISVKALVNKVKAVSKYKTMHAIFSFRNFTSS